MPSHQCDGGFRFHDATAKQVVARVIDSLHSWICKTLHNGSVNKIDVVYSLLPQSKYFEDKVRAKNKPALLLDTKVVRIAVVAELFAALHRGWMPLRCRSKQEQKAQEQESCAPRNTAFHDMLAGLHDHDIPDTESAHADVEKAMRTVILGAAATQACPLVLDRDHDAEGKLVDGHRSQLLRTAKNTYTAQHTDTPVVDLANWKPAEEHTNHFVQMAKSLGLCTESHAACTPRDASAMDEPTPSASPRAGSSSSSSSSSSHNPEGNESASDQDSVHAHDNEAMLHRPGVSSAHQGQGPCLFVWPGVSDIPVPLKTTCYASL